MEAGFLSTLCTASKPLVLKEWSLDEQHRITWELGPAWSRPSAGVPASLQLILVLELENHGLVSLPPPGGGRGFAGGGQGTGEPGVSSRVPDFDFKPA